MYFVTYIEKKFGKSARAVIEKANEIIKEYAGMGFSLTLRQLYYQFVARGLIPNKLTEYKRLGSIINDARLAGLVPWDAIEDRTRNVTFPVTWKSPQEIMKAAVSSYKLDPWVDQDVRLEVWIEKEALVGVIEEVCSNWRVPFFACRGYVSQSEQWRAGVRIADQGDDYNQETVIIHLGDHDPSGIDMTRDIQSRLRMFAERPVTVQRIALNMPQIDEMNPPPNPAKMTDSRFGGYVDQYGTESWELDALPPQFISELIDSTIQSYVDQDAYDEVIEKENAQKDQMREMINNLDA